MMRPSFRGVTYQLPEMPAFNACAVLEAAKQKQDGERGWGARQLLLPKQFCVCRRADNKTGPLLPRVGLGLWMGGMGVVGLFSPFGWPGRGNVVLQGHSGVSKVGN